MNKELKRFEQWWDAEDDIPNNGPYTPDTPIQFAWAGWQAALTEQPASTLEELYALSKEVSAEEAMKQAAKSLEVEMITDEIMILPGDGVKPWQRKSRGKSVETLQQDIEKEATRNIKRLGAVLDFDSETLQVASKVRLEEAIKAMARIRDLNRALKEKTNVSNQ